MSFETVMNPEIVPLNRKVASLADGRPVATAVARRAARPEVKAIARAPRTELSRPA